MTIDLLGEEGRGEPSAMSHSLCFAFLSLFSQPFCYRGLLNRPRSLFKRSQKHITWSHDLSKFGSSLYTRRGARCQLCVKFNNVGQLISSPHLMVLTTNEQFLPTGGTFRVILASESHWLQPVLVLSVHSWQIIVWGGYK